MKRIQIDLSDLENSGNRRNTIWMMMTEEFVIMSDIVNNLKKLSPDLEYEMISCYLDNCLVPLHESVHILDDGEVVLVRVEDSPDALAHSTTIHDVHLQATGNTGTEEPGPATTEDSDMMQLHSLHQKVIPKYPVSSCGSLIHRCNSSLSEFMSLNTKPQQEELLLEHVNSMKIKTYEANLSQDSGTNDPIVSVSDYSKTDKKKIEEETASDPTMTILNDARSVLFQRLKAKFGVYADPWAAGQNLREGLLYYEDGGPDACWLYPWTEALDELTRYIQQLDCPRLVSIEIKQLKVGSLVIATYPADFKKYRAVIEEITKSDRRGEGKTYHVRFLDYGNTSEVAAKDLHSWHQFLERVPPQAVCCKLKAADLFTTSVRPGSREMAEFSSVVKAANPLNMRIHSVLRRRVAMFKEGELRVSGPEVVVSLTTCGGENIMNKLRCSAIFRGHIGEPCGESASGSSHIKSYATLKPENLDRLDHLNPSHTRAPEPIHLLGSEAAAVLRSEPTVLHPAEQRNVDEGVDKVYKWLQSDQRCIAEDHHKKQVVTDNSLKFDEPTLSKSMEAKGKTIKDAKDLQRNFSRKFSKEKIMNSNTGIVHDTAPNKISSQIHQFVSEDVRTKDIQDENSKMIHIYNEEVSFQDKPVIYKPDKNSLWRKGCIMRTKDDNKVDIRDFETEVLHIDIPKKYVKSGAGEKNLDILNSLDGSYTPTSNEKKKIKYEVPPKFQKVRACSRSIDESDTPSFNERKMKLPAEVDFIDFENKSVRKLANITQQPSAPVYKCQQIEVDCDQTFNFMICHIGNVDKFYIHPVQTGTLIYMEMDRLMKEMEQQLVPVSDVDELMVNTVWVMSEGPGFHRFVVNTIDTVKNTVDGTLIDFGNPVDNVPASRLFRAPAGVIMDHPGMAVPCHLASVPTVPGELRSHTRRIMEEKLQDHLVYEGQLNEQGESFGIAVVCADNTNLNNAIIDFIRSSTDEKVGSIDWNPMEEDFNDLANNYRTNDDDLQVATDGYKTKGRICSFFTNSGHCYKGEYCEDLHSQPRSGAVTTDVDKITIEPFYDLELPEVGDTVLVQLGYVYSPSFFYVKFPYGAKNISELTEERRQNVPKDSEWDLMESRMNVLYKDSWKRGYFLDTLPTQGSLVACKVDGKWRRARVIDEVSSEVNVKVFLIDSSFLETVMVKNIRQLDSEFTMTPRQMQDACIDGLRPVGEGWKKEDGGKLLSLCKAADYITARIVAIEDNKLVTELTIHCGNQRLDVATALCETNHAAKVDRREKVAISSRQDIIAG